MGMSREDKKPREAGLTTNERRAGERRSAVKPMSTVAAEPIPPSL